MSTVKRIMKLMKEKNISGAELERQLGIKEKNVYSWTAGRSKSYNDRLPEIAQILGTTTAYLLCEVDNPDPLFPSSEMDFTEKEKEYITMYRAASPELQAAAFAMLEAAEKARLSRDSSEDDK